jgi:hypothetical protein
MCFRARADDRVLRTFYKEGNSNVVREISFRSLHRTNHTTLKEMVCERNRNERQKDVGNVFCILGRRWTVWIQESYDSINVNDNLVRKKETNRTRKKKWVSEKTTQKGKRIRQYA